MGNYEGCLCHNSKVGQAVGQPFCSFRSCFYHVPEHYNAAAHLDGSDILSKILDMLFRSGTNGLCKKAKETTKIKLAQPYIDCDLDRIKMAFAKLRRL